MRLAIALALGLLLAGGCAGNGGREPVRTGEAYTEREVTWLEQLARWETEYYDAYPKIDASYEAVIAGREDVGDLRQALQPLANCARDIRTDVGEPPTERLQPAFGMLVDACQQDGRSGAALLRAFSSGRGQNNLGSEAQRRSQDQFERAHESIERMLLANRPLPLLGGMTTRSRIEPRFSRAASALALKRIEVRCWSARDWRSTISEWERVLDTTTDVAGFANGKARANLAPEFCAHLVRFTYQHWRPAQGLALEDVADAVELLGHETEHLSNPLATEAEAECRGMQDVRQLAETLGASRAYAARLATAYWTQLYPGQPREYRTGRCRNGGSLDSDPESDVWP